MKAKFEKKSQKNIMELLKHLAFFLLLYSTTKLDKFAHCLTLKGGDLTCSRADGAEIQVPGITDQVSIRCTCLQGIVRCEKKQSREEQCNSKLEGCHYVDYIKGGACRHQCRGCVSSAGARYESGTRWAEPNGGNGCARRACFSGVLTATNATCPTAMCPNPLPAGPGQCCPSCLGCSRAGQLFREGQTKPDVLDPCTSCTCHQGRLECVKQTCPVLPCPSRLVKTVAGQCCPVCARKKSYTKLKTVCLFRGHVYKPGSVVFKDRCTECRCNNLPGLTVECTKETCPQLNCPLARQRRAGCCPYCVEALPAVRLASTLASTEKPAADAPAATKKCGYKGMTYSSDETWTDGCQTCSCLAGTVQCQKVSCPVSSCPAGARMVRSTTGCCPECKFVEGVCTVFGDPHYKTFDGRVFNFQGSCKYLLAQDCAGAGRAVPPGKKNNSTFSVRITNDARDSLAFSWTRTITVRVAGVKVSLMQRMRVKIDGKKVTLPYLKFGALSVMKDGYRVILRTNEGIKLLWDGVSFLEMTVPAKFRDRMCGLCGNFNGDPADDFFGRTGHIMFKDGQHFGDAWRVGGLRACSVLPRDMPHSYTPQCTQSWAAKIQTDRFCNALHSSLFESCNAKVDPGYYTEACQIDMCECPGNQCHCEVLTAYARECERAGLLVHGWREATGCRNVTSFRYGAKHFPPAVRVSGNSKNEVLAPSSSTQKPFSDSKRNREVVTSARPPVKMVDMLADSKALGPYLPGCSMETARFCKQKRPKAKKKGRLSRKERRRRRRQRKRERRKLRRKQRRRRKKKDFVAKLGQVSVMMNRNGPNPRLKWTVKGGQTPFEALLKAMNTNYTRTEEHEFEDLTVDYTGSSSAVTSSEQRPQKVQHTLPRAPGRQRTPLPLIEASSSQSGGQNQRSWSRRKRTISI